MKKSIKIICVIMMILFFLSTVSNAFSVEFKANNENVKFDEEVILNVNTDENVIATNFYIDYDHSKFEFVEGINISVAENNGKLACIYADITGTGRDNFQIKFKAKRLQYESEAEFAISEYKFVSANSNISYNEENFEDINKTVTIVVKPGVEVTPTPTMPPTPTPEPTSTPTPTVPSTPTPMPTNTPIPTEMPTPMNTPIPTNTPNIKDDTQSNKDLPNTGSKAVIVIGFTIILIVCAIYFKIKENKFKGLFIIFAVFMTVTLSSNIVKATSDTTLRIDTNNQILSGENCLLIALDNSDFDRKITNSELIREAQKKNVNITAIENKNGQNISDANVVCTGYKAIIDNNKYTVILYGDADGDGYICDSADIAEIINDYLGKKQLSDEYEIAANLMNNDNKLDVDDIMQMINRFLGKLNTSIVLNYPTTSINTPTPTIPSTPTPTAPSTPTPTVPGTPTPTASSTPVPTLPITPGPTTPGTPTPTIPSENIETIKVKVGNLNNSEENISGVKLQIKDSSGNTVKNGNLNYFVSDENGDITFDFNMIKGRFEVPEVQTGITQGANDFATYYTIQQICDQQDKKDEYFLNNGYYFDDGITYLTIVKEKNISNDSYTQRIYINSYRLLYDKIQKADGTYGKVAFKDGFVQLKLIHEKEEEKCFLNYGKIVSEYNEETEEWISKMHVSITNPNYTLSYFYNENSTNKIVVDGTETDIRIYDDTNKVNFILTDRNGGNKTITVNINHQTSPSEDITINLKVININSNNEYLSGVKYKLENENNIYTTNSNGIINIPLNLKIGENEIFLYQSEQLSGYSWDESAIKIDITRSSNSISSAVEARTGRLDTLENQKTIMVDYQNKIITIRVIHQPQD